MRLHIKQCIAFLTMIWQASGLRIHQSEEIYNKSSSSNSLNNIERDYFDSEMDQTISNVSLQWLNKAAMKIVWSDQSEEVILTTVSKQFSDLDDKCIFEGSPANINSTVFSASIIGCFDSEETIVNLGVNNEILELLLLENGTTLQNNWKNREIGGYRWSSQPSPSQIGGTSENKRVPKSIIFPLDLGYDKKLYEEFGSSTKRFIQEIVVAASILLRRPQSGFPMIYWIPGDIKPMFDININADQLCDKSMVATEERKLMRKRKGNSMPLMLFVKDIHPQNTDQTTGCAFIGTACGNKKGEAVGIVDMTWKGYSRSQHIQQMARTLAHEFGHMIGMQHDHDHAPHRACNQKGLMSYGKNRPDKWSTCSIDDFKIWWRTRGSKCEEVIADYKTSTSQGIKRIELTTHTWQSNRWFCGGNDVRIKLSNPRTRTGYGQTCTVERSESFDGGETLSWEQYNQWGGLNLNGCRNFNVSQSTKVQVMTNSNDHYCPNIVTITKTNDDKYESKMVEQRYDRSTNQQKHPTKKIGIDRIILNMSPCRNVNFPSHLCEGHDVRIKIQTGYSYCTVARKTKVNPNELVIWQKEEMNNCVHMSVNQRTKVYLITDAENDPFFARSLNIYMNDRLFTQWDVRLGPRRNNVFAKNGFWNSYHINTNNDEHSVRKIWPRDDYRQPMRDRPKTCPSNTADSCPISDMYAYRLRDTAEMNCIFECGTVTKLAYSTSLDVTDGTGFRCLQLNYQSKQYDWCCRTKRTSGGIPHCAEVLEPQEEPIVNSRPFECPSEGCPVQNVEGRPGRGTEMKSCQPGCANIYDVSSLRCSNLTHPIPKIRWCCNLPNANTRLPQCSSLTEETVEDTSIAQTTEAASEYGLGGEENNHGNQSDSSPDTVTTGTQSPTQNTGNPNCSRDIMLDENNPLYNHCWEEYRRNQQNNNNI